LLNWNSADPRNVASRRAADPWLAALEFGRGTVMALLVATHGPAYRHAGAALAIAADGRVAGAISAGCIERDLELQAAEVRVDGAARLLRYGEGSPYFDLRLPCGGAIEVLLFRMDDLAPLAGLAANRRARRETRLYITSGGQISLREVPGLVLTIRPGLRCIISGDGAEVDVFSDVLRGLGMDHLLLSGPAPPDLITAVPDCRCAVLLFHHDHDSEPAILRQALMTPAYYIGAQGSIPTQARRLRSLAEMGVSKSQLARVRGPIGLIPSTRDPVRLAISVLAELMSELSPDFVLEGRP
jgi:xanthine dehydrogenase accessory factor